MKRLFDNEPYILYNYAKDNNNYFSSSTLKHSTDSHKKNKRNKRRNKNKHK